MALINSIFSKFLSGGQKKHREEALATGSSLQILKGYIKPGSRTRYAVDSQDIVVDDDTWIFGNLEIGARVTVRALPEEEDRSYAKSIVIRK